MIIEALPPIFAPQTVNPESIREQVQTTMQSALDRLARR
jgi:hypothetical protein